MKDQMSQDKAADFRIAYGVYLGRLMSPDEVANAVAGRENPAYSTLHRWTLCGDVSPTGFELLQLLHRNSDANERVTAFSSPAGHSYVMFTHQVGAFQHRYFVPLYDSKVAQCLEDVTRDGTLGYSLGGDSHQAIVWRSSLGPRDLLPVKAMCGVVEEGDEEAVLEEYSQLLAEARVPARIPSVLDGVAVRYASVSAIAPTDLMARLARRYGVRV